MLSGAHVFITGATGFLGANLVRRMLSTGAKVTVLLRPGADRWRLHDVWDRLQIVEGNLTDLASKSKGAHLDRLDVVYDLAAMEIGRAHV